MQVCACRPVSLYKLKTAHNPKRKQRLISTKLDKWYTTLTTKQRQQSFLIVGRFNLKKSMWNSWNYLSDSSQRSTLESNYVRLRRKVESTHPQLPGTGHLQSYSHSLMVLKKSKENSFKRANTLHWPIVPNKWSFPHSLPNKKLSNTSK